MSVDKISNPQGNIIGVANCASFGKQKKTVVTATDSSFCLQTGTGLIEGFAVAGGGAGGRGAPVGGGGGAGGVVTDTIAASGTVNIQIGAGGAGGPATFPSGPLSYAPGNNTTITSPNGTLVQSCGGGGGGARGPGGPLAPGAGAS